MTSAQFDGHTVLVTGAARGIGAATVRRLAAAGARVVINDLPGGEAKALAEQISGEGGDAHPYEADVTDSEQVAAMFDDLGERFGGATGLVNNAGTVCRGHLVEFDDAEWDRVLDTNLRSAYLCLKHFARSRVDTAQGGAVVNVASMSYKGMTQQIAYVASKGGMVSMTRGAALELARHGIRVNCVAPGMIETRMTALEGGGDDKLRQAMIERIPLRRYGRPEEIASVVAFLLSADSSYMTGEVLHAAGGARL